MTIIRSIKWFDKKTEYIVSKEVLKNLSVDDLRAIIGLPYDPEDPELYDVYDITQEAADKLKAHMQHQFDFESYDYFLYCNEQRS